MDILPRHIRQAEDESLHCPNCEALQRVVDSHEELLRSYYIRVERLVQVLLRGPFDFKDDKQEAPEP